MIVNDFLKKVAVRLGDEARVATALIANKIDEAVALADYFIGTTFKKQEIKEVTI